MSSNKQKASWWIIIAFVIVPLVVSIVSTIHVVSFFQLSNYYALSLTLALAFEIGALSSLAGLVAMDKINKSTIWLIFILLTVFQMMGNTYYAYDTTSYKMITNSNLIKNFTELFGFNVYDETDVIFIKRVIAILSGAILPVISLSFLHLLVTYISKSELVEEKKLLEEAPKENDYYAENHIAEELTSETKPEITTQTVSFKGNEYEKPIGKSPLIPEPTPEVQGSFSSFLDEKKKRLEEDKQNYNELLDILFSNGETKKHDNLPSHNEFIGMIGENIYSPNTIKIFLTLCNYLKITIVNGDQRKALVNLEDAKAMLGEYLSLDVNK